MTPLFFTPLFLSVCCFFFFVWMHHYFCFASFIISFTVFIIMLWTRDVCNMLSILSEFFIFVILEWIFWCFYDMINDCNKLSNTFRCPVGFSRSICVCNDLDQNSVMLIFSLCLFFLSFCKFYFSLKITWNSVGSIRFYTHFVASFFHSCSKNPIYCWLKALKSIEILCNLLQTFDYNLLWSNFD